MISILFILIGAYLVGSFPTGYLAAKLAGIQDIRNCGSGSTGGTNVARILGIHWFFVVVFIDALKAYLYIRYAHYIGFHDEALSFIAFSILLGNIFPVFLKFRGGKGVATSVGIVTALMPGLVGYIFGIWFGVFLITQTVGIASVVGCIALPVVVAYFYGVVHTYMFLSIAITGWLLITHRANMVRFYQNLSS